MVVCLVAMLAALAGCDKADVDAAQERIVQRHRATAGGRVGVLRGLEVSDRAVAITRRLERRGHPHCGGLPQGPFQASITVEAEVLLDGHTTPFARLVEERTVRRDADGDVQVVIEATFDDPSGRQGAQRREERLVGGRLYVKEHNLPFVSHKAHHGTHAAVLDRAMDAVPAMIAVARQGWTLSEDEPLKRVYTAEQGREGSALSCGLTSADDGWLYRILERSTLSLAEVTLSRGTLGWGRRSVSGRLLVGDEARTWVVRVDVDEQVSPATEPLSVDAPEEVASVRRDRPYRDIEQILKEQLGLSRLDPG
ncbi:MAG: hypothetical protein CMH57_08160 [Myxococcales bacterium]|nr:hypothetical protein [Myxococcales bacterium]